MKLALDGDFLVSSSPADTYLFLTSPERFAPLLPMFKELKNVEEDAFEVVMEVGVPQIKGKAQVQVRFSEKVEAERASLTSQVRHALGMADAQLAFLLAPYHEGTKVRWTCDSTVRGTLASVASGILSPLAKKNVKAMIASVQNELGALEAPPEAADVTAESEGASAKKSLGERMASWVGRTKKEQA